MQPLDHGLDSRLREYQEQSGRNVGPVSATVAGAALESPPIRTLWHWWQSVAPHDSAAVPDRDRFDIAEHPALAAHLFLIERSAAGFRLRLAGEAFADMFQRRKGYEWRRDAEASLERAMAGYFDYVLEAKRPYRSTGRLKCAWSDWFAFESLLCPLRAKAVDGNRDLLLGAAARLNEGGGGGGEVSRDGTAG